MSSTAAAGPAFRPVYSWYVVTILLIASILGYVDRLVISLLLDHIKADLVLTDTQLGLISGLAFALLYVLAGVPLGRAIDRLDRGKVLALCILAWSLCTSACGLAKNFTTLFVARMGVGAGEAGLNPAAISLIGDYFPPDKVQRPISFFTSGLYIGGGLALILGGELVAYLTSLGTVDLPLLGALSAWRATFVILGIPGIVLMLLLYFTVSDPGRSQKEGTAASNQAGPSGEAMPFVRRNRRLLGLLLASVLLWGFNSYGLLIWYPAMFMRSFGLTAHEVAWTYGPAYLFGGTIGTMILAYSIGRLARAGRADATLIVSASAMALMAVCSVAAPLMPRLELIVAFTFLNMIASSMSVGSVFAIISAVIPREIRGTITGVYMSLMNILGGALGAVFVGQLTDHVVGASALNQALAIMAVVFGPTGTILMVLSIREFRRKPPA